MPHRAQQRSILWINMNMPDVPLWLYVVGFLLVLGPLVFVHEYGHYIVGRWCGVKVDAFSIGFGRKIVGWTDKRGTEWKIGWLPLGGYVQFAGDRDAVSQPDAEWQNLPPAERSHTFPAQPVWKRAAIVLAGPLTNFLFAIAIFAAFNMAYGVPATPPVIGGVEAGSAADAAGLKAGDRIARINGQAIERFDEIPGAIAFDLGQPASIDIARGSERIAIVLRPRIIAETDAFGNRSERAIIGIRSGAHRPLLRGGDAGQFADDVRKRRQRLDLACPGLDHTRGDGRLADMVEDEAHLGALLDHADDVRQVVVEDADVEDEVMRREELQRGERGDAIQPGGETGLPAKAGQMFDRAGERLLCHVPGIVRILEHAKGERVNLPLVAGNQLLESRQVAGLGGAHEFGILGDGFHFDSRMMMRRQRSFGENDFCDRPKNIVLKRRRASFGFAL